jgi:hypothetical protein
VGGGKRKIVEEERVKTTAGMMDRKSAKITERIKGAVSQNMVKNHRIKAVWR